MVVAMLQAVVQMAQLLQLLVAQTAATMLQAVAMMERAAILLP